MQSEEVKALKKEVRRLKRENKTLIDSMILDRRDWPGDVITWNPFSYYKFPVREWSNFHYAKTRREAVSELRKSLGLSND